MSAHKQALTLSLVIPAFNEENHLRACLEAIKSQSILPNEVIIVNNNSTDKTVEIAEQYPFVRVIRESKQGIVYARDAGFNSAQGDIIGRIDADTILHKDWVEHILKFYAEPENMNTAWSGGAFFYNVRAAWLTGVAQSILVFRLNQLVIGYSVTWGSNMALPKQLWEKVKNDVHHLPNIHEDIDLAIHIHKNGFKTFYDPRYKVGTKLRRVLSERNQLWRSLQWWPRTLKLHGYKGWVVTWVVGVWMLYIFSLVPEILELIARSIGKKPLRQ